MNWNRALYRLRWMLAWSLVPLISILAMPTAFLCWVVYALAAEKTE
jgi:hypothetical protein